MDRCIHQKTCDTRKSECYIFTWSVPIVVNLNCVNISTHYEIKSVCKCSAFLIGTKDKIDFRIQSSTGTVQFFVSMLYGPGKLLYSNSLKTATRISEYNPNTGYTYFYDLITLSSEDELYQKLTKLQNGTLVFICRIKRIVGSIITRSVKANDHTNTVQLNYLKSLASTLSNSLETFSKDKVKLRVDEDTETVSKAVLTAGSPVFAKMFENDMKERQKNVIIITDVKMPVLKVLVSFLYNGNVSNCNMDFDFLCELYYAASKYDIPELCMTCGDLLLLNVSNENVLKVLKLSMLHNDERLKSTAMALLIADFEVSTDNWKKLVDDEPEIAVEVLKCFDF